MSSSQKEAKIYGAIETNNYITFTGFCKKIYDSTPQEVFIYIDNEHVDTILAKQSIEEIETKYDMYENHGLCFTYDIPLSYLGEKKQIAFYGRDNKAFLNSPCKIINTSDKMYNLYNFLYGLKLSSTKTNLNKEDCTIGFFASYENLNDSFFINYLQLISNKFPKIKIHCLYFNEEDKVLAKNKLYDINNITFTIPCNLNDIINSCSFFLYSSHDERQLYNKTLYILPKYDCFILYIDNKIHTMEIEKYLQTYDKNDPYNLLQHYSILDLSIENLKNCDSSMEVLIKAFKIHFNIEYILNKQQQIYNVFLVDFLELMFQNHGVKQLYLRYQKYTLGIND